MVQYINVIFWDVIHIITFYSGVFKVSIQHVKDNLSYDRKGEWWVKRDIKDRDTRYLLLTGQKAISC